MKNLFFLIMMVATATAQAANVKLGDLPIGIAADTGTQDSVPYVNYSAGLTQRLLLPDLVNIPAFAATYAPQTTPTFLDYIGITGSTSGTVKIMPAPSSTPYTFNLPSGPAPSSGDYMAWAGSSTPMTWVSPTPGITIASYGSSPNAYGASLSGGNFTLQPANATYPGGVSVVAQTFQGPKTFASPIALAGSSSGAVTMSVGATTYSYPVTWPTASPTPGYILSYNVPMTWASPSAGGGSSPTLPTYNFYTSGTTTYTVSTPAPLYLEFICTGGGGGGGGSAYNPAGSSQNGGNGSDTTVGSIITAAHGTGANTGSGLGGVGGTCTINSPAVDVGSSSGPGGMGGGYQGSGGDQYYGTMGGATPLGGAGYGGGNAQDGGAAIANSGSGGGGGGNQNAASQVGPGGGAGGFCHAVVNNPVAGATYSITIGGGGTAGANGGSSGEYNGGAGANGSCSVWGRYQ